MTDVFPFTILSIYRASSLSMAALNSAISFSKYCVAPKWAMSSCCVSTVFIVDRWGKGLCMDVTDFGKNCSYSSAMMPSR